MGGGRGAGEGGVGGIERGGVRPPCARRVAIRAPGRGGRRRRSGLGRAQAIGPASARWRIRAMASCNICRMPTTAYGHRLVWGVAAAATGPAGAVVATGDDGTGSGAGIGAHALSVGQPWGRQARRCRSRTRSGADPAPEPGGESDRELHGDAREAGEAARKTVDGLRLERLDWLKIDDGELTLSVLAGAADTMWRPRPKLFTAAVDAPALERMAEDVKAYGYRCWRHETGSCSIQRTSIGAARVSLATAVRWHCLRFPRRSKWMWRSPDASSYHESGWLRSPLPVSALGTKFL